MIKFFFRNNPYLAYPIAAEQKELILGKQCNVPCIAVKTFRNNNKTYLPLFGRPHIDGPEVGQDENTAGKYHYHYDYRFLTVDEITVGINTQTSTLLLDPNGNAVTEEMVKDQDMLFPLEWRLRVYARKWGGLQHPRIPLEEKYVHCRLSNKICPHQGFDLTNIDPVEIDGKLRIICPGHSLNWDAETGKHLPQKRIQCGK